MRVRVAGARHWLVQKKHASLFAPLKGRMRGVPENMRLKLGLMLAILTVAGAAPAFAQANCAAPIQPAAPDGRTVTQQQMMAAVGDAKNFIAQSDVYQQCLLDYVQAQKDQAVKDKKPFDTYIETTAQKQVDDNQAAKVRAGSEINAAVNTYKMAHPK